MTPLEAKALSIVATSKMDAHRTADDVNRREVCRAMMSDEEVENLLAEFFRARGGRGATEQEATDMVNDVIALRFMAGCAELAIKGLMDIDYNPNNPPADRLIFRYREDLDPSLKAVTAARRRANGL